MNSTEVSGELARINSHIREKFQGGLECQWTKSKGRILVATRDYACGEVIFVEEPLHIVREEKSCARFKELQRLCTEYACWFKDGTFWYWCALQSLTQEQLEGGLASALCGISATVQSQLLLLHHDEVTKPDDAAEMVCEEFAPSVDPVLLQTLARVWTFNSFEHSVPHACATYFVSSFMSHSCLPNAMWHQTGTGHMLRACKSIQIGDEVCISYLHEDLLLLPSPMRQMRLHETKDFWCSCERCSSAMDYSRGFVCSKCREGIVFAHTPQSGCAAQGAALLATHILGTVCGRCGHTPTEEEAFKLWGYEQMLQASVADYTAYAAGIANAPCPGAKEIQAVEALIDEFFAQHALADLACEQLAKISKTRCRIDARLRFLQRRCAFHAAAYSGLSGAYATVLEEYGDALAEIACSDPPTKKHACKSRQVVAEESAGAAREAYKQAHEILVPMLGETHECVLQLDAKYFELISEPTD